MEENFTNDPENQNKIKMPLWHYLLDFIFNLRNLVILLTLFFILVFVLNPTKENMVCDSNYQCQIEYEFLGFIKIKRNIHYQRRLSLYHRRISEHHHYHPGCPVDWCCHRLFDRDHQIFC